MDAKRLKDAIESAKCRILATIPKKTLEEITKNVKKKDEAANQRDCQTKLCPPRRRA
jgi:hypothetical protein